jgi:hypothetical protein
MCSQTCYLEREKLKCNELGKYPENTIFVSILAMFSTTKAASSSRLSHILKHDSKAQNYNSIPDFKTETAIRCFSNETTLADVQQQRLLFEQIASDLHFTTFEDYHNISNDVISSFFTLQTPKGHRETRRRRVNKTLQTTPHNTYYTIPRTRMVSMEILQMSKQLLGQCK